MSDYKYDAQQLSAALDDLLAGAGLPPDDVLLQTALHILESPTPVLPPAVSARIEAQVRMYGLTMETVTIHRPPGHLLLAGVVDVKGKQAIRAMEMAIDRQVTHEGLIPTSVE
ncbi:MAG: hypothetical protein U0694_23885 [Anaerolineae bacterium]